MIVQHLFHIEQNYQTVFVFFINVSIILEYLLKNL